MSYYGSWKIDDLLTFYANTTRFDTGAATDADSVPTYRVYEDETGTAILTGSMALLDSGNTAGFYSEQITLSAANGFEKGKSYVIYMQATVNSVVGSTHHNFQIEAEVDANTVSPTVSANTVQISGDSAAADNAESFFDGTGYAGTNNVIPTVTTLTNLPSITSNWLTAAGIAAGALNGKGDWNIGKTGYALSVAGVQAIWDALTAALTTAGSIGKLLVDNINATIGSRSSHSAADVWAVATRVLTAGTNIVLAKGVGVTGFNDLDAAGVRSAVGMASANLDVQLLAIASYIDTEVSAIKTKTDQLTFTVANKVDTNVILIEGVDATDQLAIIASGAGSGSAIEFTYTVTNSVGGLPVQGVRVWVTTDIAGANIVWSGNTDTFGVALDDSDQKPFLDAGTYYFWSSKPGYTFINPDAEVVS